MPQLSVNSLSSSNDQNQALNARQIAAILSELSRNLDNEVGAALLDNNVKQAERLMVPLHKLQKLARALQMEGEI